MEQKITVTKNGDIIIVGYSAKEVCDKMELNIDTYYVYLGRGRSMLEDCLSSKGLSA